MGMGVDGDEWYGMGRDLWGGGHKAVPKQISNIHQREPTMHIYCYFIKKS